MITVADLLAIMPTAKRAQVELLYPHLEPATNRFHIDSPRRLAAFIAQVAHESGALVYMAEIASGETYEGRAELGNSQPGDGKKFKGRGGLMITGRANYRECGGTLGVALDVYPELAERPEYFWKIAAWYWNSRALNRFADTDSFGAITKRVNGSYTHLDERIGYWLRARKYLAVDTL